MNSLRRVVGLLMVLLASLALSNAAFGADKQYTGIISPVSGSTPVQVSVTLSNTGNSAFNSFTLAPPAGSGYTLSGPLTTTRGNISIVNNTIQVVSINLPTGKGQVHTVTFWVSAGSCTAAGGNWIPTLWTGSGLTGQNFTLTGSPLSTSYSATCLTLTYNAGTGGTVNGTSQVVQQVASGGSGTLVTATPNAGYAFVNWTPGGSTSASRTDTNVTASATYTANFAGTLTFGTQPHGALAGGYIGPVTVNAPAFANGTQVTLSLVGGGTLSGNTANVTDGVATFNNVATASNTPAGNYQLAPSVSGSFVATNSNSFAVSANNGILTCPTDLSPPPGYQLVFSDDSVFPMSGLRSGNKEGSPCVAIPFTVQVSVTATKHQINVNWDELAQPNVVLMIEATWPPELVDPADMSPKPTFYNIGLGDFVAGQCLAKGAPPAGPPEQIGTLDADIGTTETSIPITFNGLKPAGYPFPIILRSSSAGTDPERMLVKGPTSNQPGYYDVDRQTGLTPLSNHTSIDPSNPPSNKLPVQWTPMPIDDPNDGLGINAPNGAQVQTCLFVHEVTPVDLAFCAVQTSEPLKPCVQVHEKAWVTGDYTTFR